MNEFLKKHVFTKDVLTVCLTLIAFIAISVIYFYPELNGESLMQGDNIHAEGMAHEINQFQDKTGEYSAWTNSMFGGMPAYQIKSPETFNIHLMLQRFLHLFLPYSTMAILFVYLLGFYVLLKSLKFSNTISVIGALTFALSSYNIIIIAAGHITKCYAIAYMAPVLAGMIYCYQKKYIVGGLLLAFSLGIEIACNHTQILYYLAIMCAMYVVYKFIVDFKEKDKNPDWIKSFSKSTLVALIAVVFAVLPNITNLWTTWEYSKYSTRSQSELSNKQVSSGLDKDYAMAWSYGIGESFTLMIPDFKGGESSAIGNDKNAVNAVEKQEMLEPVKNSSRYWGNQPFTSGPVYVGAVIIFLFVLGMFIVENSAKWWLLAAAVFSLLMSWGNNAGWFTDLLFYYFPMYNKFRSVSMALVIAQVAIPFVAMMALKTIYDKPEILKTKKNYIYISLGLTAGLCLIFWLLPSLSGSLLSTQEFENLNEIKAAHPEQASAYTSFETELQNARKAILRSDALRSLLFILIPGVLLLLLKPEKVKTSKVFLIIGILAVIDLWAVDYRYLGPKNYQQDQNVSNVFRPSTADQFIMKDTDPDFRVLNLSANVFNDGITPYYHKTIGGYHGAKMRRYQEFIDTLLAPTVNYARMLASQQPEKFSDYISNNPVLNMLNTKFVILNPAQMPLINLKTYGNAWFVNKFDVVETADAEIGRLKATDPKQTAVINKNHFPEFVQNLPKEQIYSDDQSVISLAEYKPNYLKYNVMAAQERVAVFSEIYYPKGWTAYIDGKETEHVCADYILRAVKIPQGEHTVEFRFAPKSVKIGSIIAAIASSLILLALIAYIIMYFKSQNSIVEEVEKKQN
ncbi:MAG: YfhO family protein [Bacteroidales bacterium]|nr:YfhO family protein [Bacteroidales bacterium]